MVTEYDVYCAFRRAQANANDRGFRIPKDWDAFLLKMNKKNAEWLYKMMVHFNTTYSNIDIDEYMNCGFALWKTFTYKHFCDQKIIDLYIQRDKIKKRRMETTKEEIEKTFDYIQTYLNDKPIRQGYSQLQNFCKFRDGEVRIIINKYNQNVVDSLTLVYCLYKRYLVLSDDERAIIPYINQRYRELCENLQPFLSYMSEKETELNEKTIRSAVS